MTGNNKVWRKFTFSALTTSKIRVLTNASISNDGYSRLTEVEAYEASQTAATDRVQWIVADHLGTPRMVADLTGSLAGIKRHDYLPFGEEVGAGVGGRTSGQGYAGDNVRQQFTGYERDDETGLDYARARYYSSVQGRFTSPDDFLNDTHLPDPASWNLYVYVRNNPLRYTDPTGQIKKNKDGTVKFDANTKDGKPITEEREIGRGTLKDGRVIVLTAVYTQGKIYADDGTAVDAMKYDGSKGVTIYTTDKEGNEERRTLSTEQAKEGNIDPTSNCYGTTFAQGEVWINNEAGRINTLMKGDGYNTTSLISTPSVGDVGLFLNRDGDINSADHSVIVDQVKSGQVTGVISKRDAHRLVSTTPNKAWDDPNDKLRYFTKRR